MSKQVFGRISDASYALLLQRGKPAEIISQLLEAYLTPQSTTPSPSPSVATPPASTPAPAGISEAQVQAPLRTRCLEAEEKVDALVDPTSGKLHMLERTVVSAVKVIAQRLANLENEVRCTSTCVASPPPSPSVATPPTAEQATLPAAASLEDLLARLAKFPGKAGAPVPETPACTLRAYGSGGAKAHRQGHCPLSIIYT